jgi:hypothetical protein
MASEGDLIDALEYSNRHRRLARRRLSSSIKRCFHVPRTNEAQSRFDKSFPGLKKLYAHEATWVCLDDVLRGSRHCDEAPPSIGKLALTDGRPVGIFTLACSGDGNAELRHRMQAYTSHKASHCLCGRAEHWIEWVYGCMGGATSCADLIALMLRGSAHPACSNRPEYTINGRLEQGGA